MLSRTKKEDLEVFDAISESKDLVEINGRKTDERIVDRVIPKNDFANSSTGKREQEQDFARQDFFYGNESIVNLKTGKKTAGKSEKSLNKHPLHWLKPVNVYVLLVKNMDPFSDEERFSDKNRKICFKFWGKNVILWLSTNLFAFAEISSTLTE